MNESRRHGDEKQILEWVEMVEKTQYSGSDFYVHAFLTILATGVLGTVSYHMEKTTIEENYRQSYETMLKIQAKFWI